MQPTLYLADTCSLRNADMHAYWERDFFTQSDDRKLTILYTVRCELERQKTQPEDQEQASAALDFLKKHAERVIYLPEQAGFVKGSVADREIFYYCTLHQEGDVVLYSADKKLGEAVLMMNPLVKVCCPQKNGMAFLISRWSKVYAQLAEKHCFYLTAACVNSPAFAALMKQPGVAPLFRGKMFLSTASLPLLKESGKVVLESLELQGLAPALLVSGSICATEKNDLLARLLTHSGKKNALVLLGEEDRLSDYTELSRISLAALDHRGYTVAVLKGNGRISMQQTEKATPAPAEVNAPAVPVEPLAPHAPAPPAAPAPVPAATALEPTAKPQPEAQKTATASDLSSSDKEDVRRWVLAGNIKKAGDKMVGNDELMRHAINTCFHKDIKRLPSILQSLTQRKQKLPAACFTAYASTFLPTTANELNQHFKDKSFVTALKRLIAISAPLDECQSAVDTLQKRLRLADEPTQKVLQTLISLAVVHGAPAPTKQ